MQNNTKYTVMTQEEFDSLSENEKNEGMYLLTSSNNIVDIKVVDKYQTVVFRDAIDDNFSLDFEPKLIKVIRKKQNELINYPIVETTKKTKEGKDYYSFFDKWICMSGGNAPTTVPQENITVYAKKKSLNAPTYIKILLGGSSQSMIEIYKISSNCIFYLKDSYALNGGFSLKILTQEWSEENGIKKLKLTFKIIGDMTFYENTQEFEGEMELYSDSLLNNILGKIDLNVLLYISDASTGD